MSLTKSQKKYISKNRKNYSTAELASKLNVSYEDVLLYLKKILPKAKYEKFIKSSESGSKNKTVLEPESITQVYGKQNKFGVYLDKLKTWQIICFLAFMSFIPYLNSLPNDFVSDDIPTIKNIPPRIINPLTQLQGVYISLRVLINSAIYHVFGLNPAIFRLPNLIFHSLTSGVVYLVFAKFVPKKIAFIGACLFALHPVQAEAVAWISGAPYSQSAFFMLLAFYFWIKLKDKFTKLNYFLTLISFTLALYSDAKSVVILAAFVLFELLFGSIRKRWYLLIPHVALSIYVNSLNYFELRGRISTLSSQYQIQSGLDNPFVQLPVSLSGYFQLYIWPQFLSIYQTEITIMGTYEYAVRVAVTVIFLALIVLSFFKNKKIFFWLVFFLIALSPYLTPFRISWYVAERYAYIGTAGIAFVFACGVWYLLKRFKSLWYSIYAILFVILLALGIRTYIRNFDWKNEDTLWFATFETSPSGYQIHNNMGDVYTRRQDYETAEKFFRNATVLKPDYAAAYHNLGITQLRLHKENEALENFLKAISINPNIWQSHINVGAIYYQRSELDEALKYIEEAYQLVPNEMTVKISLATVYLRKNRLEEAKRLFSEVLQQDPSNKTAITGLKAIDDLSSQVNEAR